MNVERGGMSMAKIIRIETCVDCDHYSHAAYDDPDYCCKVEKDLLAGGVIPSWCPLEDAPSEFCNCNSSRISVSNAEICGNCGKL